MDISIGNKLQVSWEKVIEFILNALHDFTKISTKTIFAQDAFQYFRLNPNGTETSLTAFKRHLEELESNSICKVMMLSKWH